MAGHDFLYAWEVEPVQNWNTPQGSVTPDAAGRFPIDWDLRRRLGPKGAVSELAAYLKAQPMSCIWDGGHSWYMLKP